MSDFWISILSILIAFILGVFVMAWLMRGIVGPYMKARRTGVLVRVHHKNAVSARYHAAKLNAAGLYEYKVGKEKFVVSPEKGSVVRCARSYMIDVQEGQTAPFLWKNAVPVTEEDKTKYFMFEGYNDSSTIAGALDWALMKPKRKIPGLGLDMTTILIILGAIGVAIYLFMQNAGGGGVI